MTSPVTSPATSHLTNGTRIALSLMRMALALLDRERRHDLAALRLQWAIDTLAQRQVPAATRVSDAARPKPPATPRCR